MEHAASEYQYTINSGYLIQIFVLTTALSLILRFVFTSFKGSYDKTIFKVSLSLGFLFGLLFWLSGTFFISLFSYISNFPPFYLVSLFLWSFFITWSSWKFGGNAILGSVILSLLTFFLSVSSVLSFRLTNVSRVILHSAKYQWASVSIFLSILFLIFFWVHEN